MSFDECKEKTFVCGSYVSKRNIRLLCRIYNSSNVGEKILYRQLRGPDFFCINFLFDMKHDGKYPRLLGIPIPTSTLLETAQTPITGQLIWKEIFPRLILGVSYLEQHLEEHGDGLVWANGLTKTRYGLLVTLFTDRDRWVAVGFMIALTVKLVKWLTENSLRREKNSTRVTIELVRTAPRKLTMEQPQQLTKLSIKAKQGLGLESKCFSGRKIINSLFQ